MGGYLGGHLLGALVDVGHEQNRLGGERAEVAQRSRSILGRGSVVSAGASVVDSVLMAGCHVAADAKVAGSVMGTRSIVGQRGDVRAVSVLGAGAVVSSGTLVDGERVSG